MISIMDVIRPELCKLSALELENFATFDFVHTLESVNINQSAPNLVTVYMTIRSRMSLIMDLIGLEHLELFACELEKMLI